MSIAEHHIESLRKERDALRTELADTDRLLQNSAVECNALRAELEAAKSEVAQLRAAIEFELDLKYPYHPDGTYKRLKEALAAPGEGTP